VNILPQDQKGPEFTEVPLKGDLTHIFLERLRRMPGVRIMVRSFFLTLVNMRVNQGAVSRNIIFYKTDDGKCPVEEFLDSLRPKVAQKVLWVLRLIEELDRVPSQYFKKLTGTEEIWESRIRTQSSTYRVFSFFVDGDTLVLTHGYSKKTRKTDSKQIKRAEGYRRDYLSRKRRPL
jgi:phage-related protein